MKTPGDYIAATDPPWEFASCFYR